MNEVSVVTDVIAKPAVQAGIALVVLAILIALAFWVLARLRDYTTDDQLEAPELLANLEEMRRKGDISEEEFRTIQAATRSTSASTTHLPVPSASQADSGHGSSLSPRSDEKSENESRT
ncbi:hypothetical protein LOC71_05575 [Rhodopirellula sp. JC740]|uniref:SHOCT domain-containing protein n=1 Tax=Rhodopirellula halodulae TaxID=2894198 RepID=A0ABS8NDV3_9BACT|nr:MULTISPECIES: hypothetical protein [unclassified Rhodopirellula]MCC9641735.1 hypothetical protein [Rhodopirellula sp. JC740]MCC9654727.1 hypothetical protein [Rhodopirellula sp. JC737]